MEVTWISVKERLPERDARYLVHCRSADPEKPLIAVAWFDPEERTWSLLPHPWIKTITHWMEVPPPPTP